MAASRPRPVKHRENRPLLDRNAWLRAAGDAVAEGGFSNLRILLIAQRLGVTRGSFYWHFRDHAEFVRAFLNHWLAYRRHRTEVWMKLVTEHEPEAALLHSLEINFEEGRNSYRNLRIELSVRDFARQDAFAAEVLAKSDELRHAKSVELYTALTGDAERGRLLALLTYLVIAGSDLVLQGARRNEATVNGLKALCADLLVRQQRGAGAVDGLPK